MKTSYFTFLKLSFILYLSLKRNHFKTRLILPVIKTIIGHNQSIKSLEEEEIGGVHSIIRHSTKTKKDSDLLSPVLMNLNIFIL